MLCTATGKLYNHCKLYNDLLMIVSPAAVKHNSACVPGARQPDYFGILSDKKNRIQPSTTSGAGVATADLSEGSVAIAFALCMGACSYTYTGSRGRINEKENIHNAMQ